MPSRLCDRGGNGKERRKVLEGEEGDFVACGSWCSSLNMEGRAASFNEARRNKKGRKGVSCAEETQQKTNNAEL